MQPCKSIHYVTCIMLWMQDQSVVEELRAELGSLEAVLSALENATTSEYVYMSLILDIAIPNSMEVLLHCVNVFLYTYVCLLACGNCWSLLSCRHGYLSIYDVGIQTYCNLLEIRIFKYWYKIIWVLHYLSSTYNNSKTLFISSPYKKPKII